jgi:hypothetical protein
MGYIYPCYESLVWLNQPMGKGKTMRETSQLGGEKLYIDAPKHLVVSLAIAAV